MYNTKVQQFSSLEQRSIIKFLLAVKCKPCEIYQRICDVYEEACFNQKNVYKWANHEFTIMRLTQKDSPLNGNIWTLL